jgi:hypothetical protein
MSAPDDITARERAALFVDDRELHRRINPAMKFEAFLASVRAVEREDPSFPKVKALWGGRNWRAVVAWFDKHDGVANNELAPSAEDQRETFSAPPRKKARVQEGTGRPALLDREPALPGHDGLPGTVHRLAARRERR